MKKSMFIIALLIIFTGGIFLYKDNETRVENLVDEKLICDYCESRGYDFDYVEIEKDDSDYITYLAYKDVDLVTAGGINRNQLIEKLSKVKHYE